MRGAKRAGPGQAVDWHGTTRAGPGVPGQQLGMALGTERLTPLPETQSTLHVSQFGNAPDASGLHSHKQKDR